MDEVPEMMNWVHVDTMRLLEKMYHPWEIGRVIEDLRNSDGWLIISFRKIPVLDYIETNTVQRYNWRLN